MESVEFERYADLTKKSCTGPQQAEVNRRKKIGF